MVTMHQSFISKMLNSNIFTSGLRRLDSSHANLFLKMHAGIRTGRITFAKKNHVFNLRPHRLTDGDIVVHPQR